MTPRKCMTGLMAVALCLCLTACKQTLISPTKTTTATTTTTSAETTATTATTTTTASTAGTTTATGDETDTPDAPSDGREDIGTAYPDKKVGFQLEKPEVGEQIVILHTTKGDISIRLFPEAAPKAVENFVTHAKNGYFDGQIFHYVSENSHIQSGDPTGTGEGGESIWGEDFEDEFDTKLFNLTGAVSMANSGPDSNGSQFFINHRSVKSFGDREIYSPEYREEAARDLYDQLVETYGEEQVSQYYKSWEDLITDKYVYEWIPDEVWDVYEKHGGNIRLDAAFRESGGNTVFGQVFEGLDVVEDISAVVTDSNDKPAVSIVIQSAEVTTYQG